ncbi:MAG TPA: hypothetical protein VM282_22610 [Acidimicrobiales bacterium]|nr:hypothetical protein [Acidimicrobiales bacterium]
MRDPATAFTLCVFDVLWLDGIDCTQLAYRERRRVLEVLELSGLTWCTVPRFPFDDAEDLLDACARLDHEGIVLEKLDARYLPCVRTDAWRKVKRSAWRTDHAPRRLPPEIRERIGASPQARRLRWSHSSFYACGVARRSASDWAWASARSRRSISPPASTDRCFTGTTQRNRLSTGVLHQQSGEQPRWRQSPDASATLVAMAARR